MPITWSRVLAHAVRGVVVVIALGSGTGCSRSEPAPAASGAAAAADDEDSSPTPSAEGGVVKNASTRFRVRVTHRVARHRHAGPR